jgi:hypothetical protein
MKQPSLRCQSLIVTVTEPDCQPGGVSRPSTAVNYVDEAPSPLAQFSLRKLLRLSRRSRMD